MMKNNHFPNINVVIQIINMIISNDTCRDVIISSYNQHLLNNYHKKIK